MNETSLADRVLARDPRAIARAISLIENDASTAGALVGRLFPKSGRAFLIGVTGPPGAGKSTLVDRMTAAVRQAGRTVGILAVDPTSPYSGGAVLGDRVRMQSHAEDDGVFIRSMATRGHLGGLARSTTEAATVLDAAGYDVVIIETVGVGQDEVDIVRTADVSVVMVVPGTGDDVQALKAGIMEIADIFVVNKADREGADRTAASIEAMLSLEEWGGDAWRPPVLRTVATTNTGVDELMATIDRYREHAEAKQQQRRRARAEWRLRELLERRFMRYVEQDVLGPDAFAALVGRVAAREVDPYRATEDVMGKATAAVPSQTSGEAAGDVVTLDHVGVAAADAAPFVALFQQWFGRSTDEPEDVGAHRVRFVATGETTVELVEALTPDSPVAKFLEKRGAALHHLCVRVRDIEATMTRLRGLGVKFIDQTPRPGAHGSRIAFIHPSSALGLLVELKQARN